ncbi:MAG: hypothetical protein CMJ48_04280 [Planctomycetaceae bacterium]|nr:hypothetical protein [Planctomycetaceae bacterium]
MEDHTTTSDAPKRRLRLAPLLLLAAAGLGFTLLRGATSEQPPMQTEAELPASPVDSVGATEPVATTEDAPQSSTAAVEASTEDERCREMVVGTWEQEMYGKRYLTVREDGSAEMIVEPDGVWSLAFGDKVTIEIRWKVENGKALFSLTGGMPSKKVDMVVQLWGRDWVQKILAMSREKMLLLGEDGETEYAWTRVETVD